MALRLMEDFFEIGANPENISGSGWSIVGGRVAGSGCVSAGGSAGLGQWLAYPGQAWSSALDELYCGFALRATPSMQNTNIISFYSNGNTAEQMSLRLDSNGRLAIRRGGTASDLATSSIPFSTLAQWRSINIYLKVHDTTGSMVVKVDGVTHINYTAGDTLNTSPSSIDGIRVNLASGSSSNSLADLVLLDTTGTSNNTFPGDVAVIRRLPNSNGTYSQFTGSDGNSTDNYQLVDEAPSNDSDYVYSTSAGQKDSYGVENLPASTISVLGVRAVAKCAKSGAGQAGMSVFVRENGTDTFGSSTPLSTTFSWQGDEIREKAPSTSAAWTVSDVNDMEIGVRSEAS